MLAHQIRALGDPTAAADGMLRAVCWPPSPDQPHLPEWLVRTGFGDLLPPSEPAQPATHRLRRTPQLSRDPPMPRTASFGRQGRADHRRDVRAAGQHQHQQHHMPRPAAGAASTTRDQPQQPATVPDVAGTGVPPPVRAPEHPGHAKAPDPNRRSTPAASVSTVSTPHLRVHTHSPPTRFWPGRRREGRALPTRRSSRWRRRPPKSNQARRSEHHPHTQRRQPRATSASSTAGNVHICSRAPDSWSGVFPARSLTGAGPLMTLARWELCGIPSTWQRPTTRQPGGSPRRNRSVRCLAPPPGWRVVALREVEGMPHLPTSAQSQQRSWLAIPEACPPGEGMFWLLSAALGDVARLGEP
jgi:hypothetical protein